MMVNSYGRSTEVPEVGSVWVWAPNSPNARVLVRVVEVRWNGEEWWVKTEALPPLRQPTDAGEYYNDAGRFHESVTPVGSARWTKHAVTDGVEFVVGAA